MCVRKKVVLECVEGYYYLKDDAGNYLQENSVPKKSVVFGGIGNAVGIADEDSIREVAKKFNLRIVKKF